MEIDEDEDGGAETCDTCGGSFNEAGQVTEEMIEEHYENAGFSRIPESAFDRVGDPCCPLCGSQFFAG